MPPDVREPIKIAHVTATDYSLIYLLRNQLIANRDAGYEVIGVSHASERDHLGGLTERRATRAGGDRGVDGEARAGGGVDGEARAGGDRGVEAGRRSPRVVDLAAIGVRHCNVPIT